VEGMLSERWGSAQELELKIKEFHKLQRELKQKRHELIALEETSRQLSFLISVRFANLKIAESSIFIFSKLTLIGRKLQNEGKQ